MICISLFNDAWSESKGEKKVKTKAIPTEAQMNWQDAELGMFAHFGLNTFNGKEWSDGTLDKNSFNPEKFDAYQWVKTAKDAGFKYFMLTAKHHDGFCLWQTKTTDYSVKSISWKDGKGDVVRDVSNACEKLGIKFGVYLSPWDRHEKCYTDKEAYDKFYIEQLEELMTGYGDIFEVWFDGAGSEGRVYDWDKIIGTVHKYHPNAMIFNMGTPTIRWVGNEAGIAPQPCFNEAKEARVSMFTNDMLTWSEKTPLWVPAECDATIRRGGWFWHENEENTLRQPDELEYIYLNSVGHGANLLLNIAPDKDGLLPKCDVERVNELGDFIRSIYENKIAEVSSDKDETVIEFEEFKHLSYIVTAEDIRFGENIRKYRIDADMYGGWIKIAEGTSVGHKKIDAVKGICAKAIRFTVLEKSDNVRIKSIAVCG